jgi:hypothetical protein
MKDTKEPVAGLAKPAAAQQKHFDPKGKLPSEFTIELPERPAQDLAVRGQA